MGEIGIRSGNDVDELMRPQANKVNADRPLVLYSM
jgi:hypothetical protein